MHYPVSRRDLGVREERLSSSRFRRVSTRDAARHLTALLGRDYGGALRERFNEQEVRKVVFSRFSPELNRRVFAGTDVQYLSEIAAQFGVMVHAVSIRFQGLDSAMVLCKRRRSLGNVPGFPEGGRSPGGRRRCVLARDGSSPDPSCFWRRKREGRAALHHQLSRAPGPTQRDRC